ncbi:structural protein [Synechococcus phage ACG-2014e]|uniref:Structural protein n=1 Tax=Synechococcus phage ACG-2014e TaxID=1493510 RepID=A0A0E3FM45_9CAUD|nr:structural protein [Synechococcus phage ACG-2014e]AIX20550.1 structural protein [Synechococcus phage ACG-2014e]AIX29765.1 structural protein [Synechococcus phage ACG-2014e]
MPQKTNLNVNPYYEDFDASKNFYKILFRPGYSIQTRELTQIQSILQNQVESFGKYAFKQGDLVVPGEVGLNTKLDYVKLSSVSEVAVEEDGDIVYKKYDISQLIGRQLRGLNSGVISTVLETKLATETTADTVYVNYLNSGNSNNESKFRQGETLEVVDGINTPLLVVGTDGSVLPTSIQLTNPDTGDVTSIESPAMGFASAVEVEEGIYFVNGYFVRCSKEILVIDDYYNSPSSKVGFRIQEEIITPEEDASLYDNSIGSSNFTAPGAHRLKISLKLVKFEFNQTTDKNFIQLLTTLRGAVQRKVSPTNYSLIEQTLARRTFDESGDYVVGNFDIDVREYAQKNKNGGLYKADAFGLYNGLTEGEASRKMLASVSTGKAYIKGYEIVNKETKYLEINKARASLTSDNIRLKTKSLPTLNITNVYGSVPLNKEGADLTAYPYINLYSTFNDGSVGLGNSELPTDHRQTTDRRGQVFGSDDATKTIVVEVTNTTQPLSSITDANFDILFGEIHFIKTRNDAGTATSTSTVKGIAFAKVNKPLINANDSVKFLELTILGKKDDLDLLFVEFDLGDSNYQRKIFLTSADASTDANEIGFIVDYSETITPVIGRAKPNNFALKKKGSGFNSDSDIILSQGRQADGSATYNATFGLSYFDPEFFTKILLDTVPTQGAFGIGKYIFGLKSGAYGVVEGSPSGVYSVGKLLFIKTLSGRFQSGESIKDEGGNVVKIAKDNTVSHFIVTNPGLGYAENSNIVINGVEYDNSVVDLARLNSGAFYRAEIKNKSALSTEYAQPPAVTVKQPDGSATPAQGAVILAVLTRNAITTYTPQNVKSVSAKYGSAGENVFTADVVVDDAEFAEIKSITDFTFFGDKGYNFIESTSFNADASNVLQQGDIIQFSDTDNNLVRSTIQYATIKQGAFKTRIYLDTMLPGDVVNTSIVRLRPRVGNANQGTLIYPTGSSQIKQISSTPEETKIKYFFRRDFVTTAATSGGVITFAAQLPFGTQRFAAFTEENYIITVLDPGDSPNVHTGDIVYIDKDAVEISSSTDTSSGLIAGSISLKLPTTYFGTIPSNGTYPKLKLTATLEVENAKPRLKTSIENRRIVITSSGDRVIPFRGINYDTEVVETLSYSDAYKLRYVYEGSATQPPQADSAGSLISGSDVTDRFTFDNGQRDTVYDVSRLVLKPGYEQTTGQLLIAFDYFEHSAGDFCTIDSYIHEAGVTEDEIPSFNSSVYGIINLKNILDFRPKVDTTASIAGFQDTASLASSIGPFAGAGAIVSSSPASDTNLEYTLSFSQIQYLDRIDGVFLNKNGKFIIKEGNSSLNPSKPDPVDDAIPLFYAYIPAFTQNSKDVRITPVDNRRYTMRDIGKLEKRIERLEYYTTLSVLEQQALNMQVKDEIGFDRFKSGFLVDNFESHRTGNLTSLDYQCSIDSQQSVLRPQSKEDSFILKEVNTREDQRVVSGYKKSGDIVTLPYSNLEFIGNNFASKTLNPNPFVVLQYVGDSVLSPSIDQWYDTTEEPLVVDTNTDLYKIFLSKENVKESFSSLYNSFVINWVGSSPSFSSINSLGSINSQDSQSKVKLASTASSSNISPKNNDVAKGVQTKTIRGNSVSSALQFFARSIPVKFVVRRLKPNTTISVFLEGRNISRWVNPDLRFTGIAGNSPSAFNGPVTTDDDGNASGIIVIPAGLPPEENTTWTGDVDTLSYDSSGEEVKIAAGIKTFRFTSSPTDEEKSTVTTYAEVKYYATGILPENPGTIVSTKPSFFKANEGVQFIDSNTDNPVRPNPLAQTFKVENYEGGIFTTGLDLYFNKKSNKIPVKVYLTNVDSDKPGKNIIPGTEKVISPFTFLKIFTNGNVYLTQGESITGSTSAASGPLAKIIDKNGVDLVPSSSGRYLLTNEQVYTMVLDNHNGRSFNQNESLIIPSVILSNNTQGTNSVLTIAKDSGKVSAVKILNPGLNYDSAIISIESPQLPGGSVATARVEVSGGKIYNTEISLTGFGYTEPPSVVVRGVGNGAGGCVIETEIEIDTPAVRMGVAIDSEGLTNSTTPTHFSFDHPVYLQNDTEYALAVETDSIDYELWVSRLGETDIATSTVITTQPSLGSVYRSQNTENWTEDNFEDIKFKMYRAEFDITRTAELVLTNEDLGYELLEKNPFQTSATANTNATSLLFRNNNNIVRVNHRDHGFETLGDSYVFYRTALETGGITSDILNNTLFQISNSGVDTYDITSSISASGNIVGGGDKVYASYNRKYETLYPQMQYLTFTGTKLESTVKTTNVIAVDASKINYDSYDQSDYEKTFLNEPHYFTNQKFISSSINEILNNLTNSLSYKLELSSTVSHLSPVVDLSTSSVKTSTNRIEKAYGQEDRYGRRDQVIEFYPIYSFTVSNISGVTIQNDQAIEGYNSKAVGKIAKVSGNTIWVKLKTSQFFQKGERVTLGNQPTLIETVNSVDVPRAVVDTNPIQNFQEIPDAATITARNPATPVETYDNIITGKAVIWNDRTQELTLRTDTQPIAGDFNGRIQDNDAYARKAQLVDQVSDIFRVGDIVSYPNQPADEVLFLEVGTMTYSNGSEFVSELTSRNSSSSAKYITKEVAISNPATAIDVHLTLNIRDLSDIEVLYKFKKASSNENFEDIDWEYFNGTGQPDSLEIATPENSISSVIEKQESYQDITYSVAELPEFSSFAVKIVMKGTDPAYVPKIQDIRAVAAF